jgi:RND family efflux transporter MFP subunit
MKTTRYGLLAGVLALAACGSDEAAHDRAVDVVHADAPVMVVQLSTVPALLDAAGVAEPYAEATLSTKLMGTITDVRVREGDRVRAGQVLLVLDARELTAKQAQVEASIAEAEAMRAAAGTHAERMRALFAEQAAPKAQLDAAETSLARAEAAVRAAHAGAAELAAVTDYSVVRAPFDGVIVRRAVDPGAFAAPGAPLLTIQHASRLRVRVTASPDAVRGLHRGTAIDAWIERQPASAVVEGVVPVGGGSVYTVNAIVDNAAGVYLPGSAASLSLPQGTRSVVLIPASAVQREGDLTGVRVRSNSRDELRWVRLGRTHADSVEVLAGLRAGEQVVLAGSRVQGS